MTSERTQQALTRIDAALTRIRHASTQAEAQAASQARQHETLRQAVRESLRDLDILIGGRSEGPAA